jgi:hypothetical protein
VPQIAVLETVLPFLEYYEVRDRYREAKVKQRDLHARVAALKRKTQPIEQYKRYGTPVQCLYPRESLNRRRRLESESRRLSEQREQKKKAARKHMSDLQRTSEENDNLVRNLFQIYGGYRCFSDFHGRRRSYEVGQPEEERKDAS